MMKNTNKRVITIKIEYEESEEYMNSHHSFYLLDKFVSGVKTVIENFTMKDRDSITFRITKSIDYPKDN